MSVNIRISLNEGLYLKDPQDSELGRKFIENSVLLINEIGFEAFTFKKLADSVDSTEASIYRYFKNKHSLLLYLVSWYWEWVIFLMEFNSMNVTDARKKLSIIIRSFISASSKSDMADFVDKRKLQKIVISEGGKAYFTKEVDKKNGQGFYESYKNLVEYVSQTILEINPKFVYPHTLATNLFEMSNNHVFFARHLPVLTDAGKNLKISIEEDVEEMLNHFIDKLLK